MMNPPREWPFQGQRHPSILVGTQAFGLGWQKRPFRPKEKLTFSVLKKRNFKTGASGYHRRASEETAPNCIV